MGKDALHKELTNLERKITLLLAEHSRLKDVMEHKEEENAQLRAQLGQQEVQIDNFQNKDNISKIVGNTAVGDDEAKELRVVLDDYIHEIDKCIAHLGEA